MRKKKIKKKIILDLCGGTGSWSLPYKEAGYDVRNITWPKFDVRLYEPPKNVYGILAAPPCTQFSVARTTARIPRDLGKGMELVRACLNIIWRCRISNKLAFWALENPRGILRQFLGKSAFTFQPYEFGDRWTKHTDLWGYFKEPKKLKRPPDFTHTEKTQFAKNNRILPDLPEGYIAHKLLGQRSQAARRAITPPGFAQAFYEANN